MNNIKKYIAKIKKEKWLTIGFIISIIVNLFFIYAVFFNPQIFNNEIISDSEIEQYENKLKQSKEKIRILEEQQNFKKKEYKQIIDSLNIVNDKIIRDKQNINRKITKIRTRIEKSDSAFYAEMSKIDTIKDEDKLDEKTNAAINLFKNEIK